MRLLRRNALGVYAVYAAAILSGLLVTPVVIHSIGTSAFGVWSFIGSVTIYLSILDLGVGPSIIRFAAEARGRRADHDLNEVASTGLTIYALIGLLTLPVGLALAFIVPAAVSAPPDLVWDARITTFLVVLSLAARFPLGLFNNLLLARQRWDLQNLANFVSTVLYAALVAVLMPRYGGLVLLGALTLGTTLLRLTLPLFWLHRELPGLHLSRALVSRARLRQLAVVQLVELPGARRPEDRVLDRCDRRRDRARLGRVRRLFRPGEALCARLRHRDRGDVADVPRLRRAGGRGSHRPAAPPAARRAAGGLRPDARARAAAAPDPGPADPGLDRRRVPGSYSVMAILAVVLLVHQPIYVLTQFLIARAQQRAIAVVSIVVTVANLILSFVLAWTWGLPGVAVSTLATDAAMLLWIVPRIAAPASGSTSADLVRAIVRPVLPASVAAVVILVGLARWLGPDHAAGAGASGCGLDARRRRRDLEVRLRHPRA